FYSYFGPLVRGEVLDEVIDVLRPDAALILSLYYTAGLAIHYRYRLPVVFFTPQLKKGNRIIECESVEHDILNVKSGLPELLELLTKARVRFKSLKDIARLVLQLPELALLPEAFDLPGRGDEPGVYYIGAGVDMKRTEASFSWDGIDPNR